MRRIPLIAQSPSRPAEKRAKDLAQARELMGILEQSNPWSVRDALDGARSRGTKWRQAVDRSLAELGLA
ncbi:hypothetical protein RA307_27065 [Xanthobacteraceae bacterium Astr-EGSB]|uniref:hypothetical protein n=1 Tax=Astrobacterium formosum TaxID=3069710 RepID=UPI0027B5C943|nr:hypothetical protein [Xanthobacteraceae bacterium Astr-EGSB]